METRKRKQWYEVQSLGDRGAVVSAHSNFEVADAALKKFVATEKEENPKSRKTYAVFHVVEIFKRGRPAGVKNSNGYKKRTVKNGKKKVKKDDYQSPDSIGDAPAFEMETAGEA